MIHESSLNSASYTYVENVRARPEGVCTRFYSGYDMKVNYFGSQTFFACNHPFVLLTFKLTFVLWMASAFFIAHGAQRGGNRLVFDGCELGLRQTEF